MRVIAGTLKGRPLASPGKGTHAIRPTSDMAREALFSILQRWPTEGFLDLFSGTGAVALEAWSRGYGPVTAVEQSAAALEIIRKNFRDTDIHVVKSDVRRIAEDTFAGLSVVFADPPYAESEALWVHLAPRIRRWLAPDGVLVWESERRTALPLPQGWKQVDERRYGRALLAFLQTDT